MSFPNSSRPVSVQDIRSFTARETRDAKKIIAGTKIAHWYRATRLEKCAHIRASMQRAYYKSIVKTAFMFWLRYSQTLKASRIRSYRNILDRWRAPLEKIIVSLRHYEKTLISRVFFNWRADPGVRIRYIELLMKNEEPSPHIKKRLQRTKLHNILIFWRSKQVLLKCINIGLDLSIAKNTVTRKVPGSSTNPFWQGYLFYLKSLSAKELTVSSVLSKKLLLHSFTSWKYKAISILKEKSLRLQLREMELRLLRPFFKAWILLHRMRPYILDRVIFRWQLTLSVRIRHIEAAKAAIELRKYAIKRAYFNNWTRSIFSRELLARHHCLEKIYGTTPCDHNGGFMGSAWLKYALFFIHSLLSNYKVQATAFRCLRRFKSAVDYPKYWKRLTVLAHGTYYISRLRLYLRAWAFVAFKMKTIENRQRSFCATDDIVFQTIDIKMLHEKHNTELSCFESLCIMNLISKNNIQLHRLAILCKEDKYNCLLLMKLRRYISSQSNETINYLYSGLCNSNAIASVDCLLLKFSIVAMVNLNSYNRNYISIYYNRRTFNVEDPVTYRQTMGLIQRNLAIRYHEFLSATDLLYSKLYTSGTQSSSEKKIISYITGKFPSLRRTLNTKYVALLTTAFLLETPTILFTDRLSVISSSFLLQTWMGNRQCYTSWQEKKATCEASPRVLARESISIVDSVYFTGLSRDFNEKGVAMLIPPSISPVSNSISATEHASLWTQLETLKHKRFFVSNEAECWLLGAIASASERELQLAANYRKQIYLKHASHSITQPLQHAHLEPNSQDEDIADIYDEIGTESLDLIQLFKHTRLIPIDRFTTEMVSTDALRVTVDEMKHLIETVRTSVVHPSLLLYINAKGVDAEPCSTKEAAVSMDILSLPRSLDEILKLENSVTNTTMRIIERSFSVAPLSQVNTGSFCMLPDEQTINSPDMSFIQSSQLLSRSNSYVSPSFENFSHSTTQPVKASDSIKKTIFLNKPQHVSPRKKIKPKSGGHFKRNTTKQGTHELTQSTYRCGQNRNCKTAGISNKRKVETHIVKHGENCFSSGSSKNSHQVLCADSFHINALDDFQDDNLYDAINNPIHMNSMQKKDAYNSSTTLRPHSSYYSSTANGKLSSGRSFLGKLSSRPRTTASYLNRRMNNSQRSSNTESSDDIKLQEQHRVESATSYRPCAKQRRGIVQINHHTDNSSMATVLPTTTCISPSTEEPIKSQSDTNLFPLSFLTRYQRSLLALHIWRKSLQGKVYMLSDSAITIPEIDIQIYSLSSGQSIASLDTIINAILYNNIMLLYDNEDADQIFQEIWLTDPQFIDENTAKSDSPMSSVAREHFSKFWNYAKILADEYVYELVYEGDHAFGDKIMRSIRSAPIFYSRMLHYSLVETVNLVNSMAEATTSHWSHRKSRISSAWSRSGLVTFSQMTLDDLSTGLIAKRNACSVNSHTKPITTSPCILLSRSPQKTLSNFASPRLNNSQCSPRIVYSVVNMSLCDDNIIAFSISSPRPLSKNHRSLVDSTIEEASPYLSSPIHSLADKSHISYTPKMARLTLNKDNSPSQNTSYLRSHSVPLVMAIPQPLGQLTIDTSLLTVKADLPIETQTIKPFLISSSVAGRLTTIHKTKDIQPVSTRKIYSDKRIGGLAYSESREVFLSRPNSKSTVEKSQLPKDILSNHNTTSLTSLDDALNLKEGSILNSIDTSTHNTTEKGIEPPSNYDELGAIKDFRSSIIVHGYGNVYSAEQKQSNIFKDYAHTRSASSPQPGSPARKTAKIGNIHLPTASLEKSPTKIKCVGLTQALIPNNEYICNKMNTYTPTVSKSVQPDYSPKRPSSGLKVFYSSSHIPQHKVNETDTIRKQNRILTDHINQLPLYDRLLEKVGPAISSLLAQRNSEENIDILDFSSENIDELYKYSNYDEELSSIQLNTSSIRKTHHRDVYNYKSSALSPNLEVVSIVNNQVSEGTVTETVPSRYSSTRTQTRDALHKTNHEHAYCSATNTPRKDQVVLNAKQDYKHCLFNRSVNFKQKTFNSILRPREIDEKYVEMRDKLKSRMGSRAPSRLSSRGNISTDQSLSHIRPLLTSPGRRRRENLLVITMDPPTQAESTKDNTESTSIGIRINEQLFGINHVY